MRKTSYASLSLSLPCPLVDETGEVMAMELEKNAGGVGFSIEGGKGSIHGDRPLTVSRVFTGTDT